MLTVLCSERFYEQGSYLIGSLSQKLIARNMFLGVAESCTGGLLATLCTELAGSSRWFTGGVVTYSNKVKSSLLHVDPELLAVHGAVSGQAVEAMVHGALKALTADVAISISGIAGPDGGSAEKPVGTVWMGLALSSDYYGKLPEGVIEQNTFAPRCHFFPGDRGEVRRAAVLAALEALHGLLDAIPLPTLREKISAFPEA